MFITDVVNIPELIGYVRERANPPGNTLAGILPPQTVDDIEYELQNIEAPTVQIARYRAWDAPPPLGTRPGFAVVRGEIAPLGLTMRLNEKELERFARIRAGLPGGSTQDIYDDALIGVQAVATRVEKARADLLLDGVVTINENGCDVTADFDVPGTNIVSAGTAWTDHANSVPVTNFQTWDAVYRAANGGRSPDAWLISSPALADLVLNAQIRNLAPVTGVVPGVLTAETVGQVLRANNIGTPLVVFDGELPNDAGVYERLIDARKVIGVRAGMGNVFVGTTPTAQLLVGRGIIRRQEAPGWIAFVEEQVRPAAVYTTGEGVALPVLKDPKALFVATV